MCSACATGFRSSPRQGSCPARSPRTRTCASNAATSSSPRSPRAPSPRSRPGAPPSHRARRRPLPGRRGDAARARADGRVALRYCDAAGKVTARRTPTDRSSIAGIYGGPQEERARPHAPPRANERAPGGRFRRAPALRLGLACLVTTGRALSALPFRSRRRDLSRIEVRVRRVWRCSDPHR